MYQKWRCIGKHFVQSALPLIQRKSAQLLSKEECFYKALCALVLGLFPALQRVLERWDTSRENKQVNQGTVARAFGVLCSEHLLCFHAFFRNSFFIFFFSFTLLSFHTEDSSLQITARLSLLGRYQAAGAVWHQAKERGLFLAMACSVMEGCLVAVPIQW